MKTHRLNDLVQLIQADGIIYLCQNSTLFEIPPDFVYLGLAITIGKSPALPPYKASGGFIFGQVQCAKQQLTIHANMFIGNDACFNWYKYNGKPEVQWLVQNKRIQEIMDVLEEWMG